jgi:hypothetical protein
VHFEVAEKEMSNSVKHSVNAVQCLYQWTELFIILSHALFAVLSLQTSIVSGQ